MFCFGAAYYPKQWSEERRAKDARLMAETGFNVVRLTEFAWSKMEPRENGQRVTYGSGSILQGSVANAPRDLLVLLRGETKR